MTKSEKTETNMSIANSCQADVAPETSQKCSDFKTKIESYVKFSGGLTYSLKRFTVVVRDKE